jgi:hypothetical protein
MDISVTSRIAAYPSQARAGHTLAATSGTAAVETGSLTEAFGQQTTPSPADHQILQQLQARDREVRAHELAHVATGAGLVSGASFSYQRGPDGRFYAVGGEVSIDTSPVPGDPQATASKAEQIQRAALAPAQPSGQDRAVAAQAARMAMEARLQQALEASAPEDRPATLPPDLYA